MPIKKYVDLSVISNSGLSGAGLRACRCLAPDGQLALGSLLTNGDVVVASEARALWNGIHATSHRLSASATRSQINGRLDGDRKECNHTATLGGRLSRGGLRRLKSLLAQSRAAVLEQLTLELVEEMIPWCRRLGTFVSVTPLHEQLGALEILDCDLLVLSSCAAAKAVGASVHESTDRIFQQLLQRTSASRVVQIGGDNCPILFADRVRDVKWVAAPAAIDCIQGLGNLVPTSMPVEADVLTTVVTRCIMEGQAMEVALHWGRLLAVAQTLGVTFHSRKQVEVWHHQNTAAFAPIVELARTRAVAA